ncbi:MAG: hypothetical protein DMF08_01935 [Verrucomicrobia bacterium]|nr:MAG: hypothetical protein DMF08_01935 [Verrucomicrobiota bacterium]
MLNAERMLDVRHFEVRRVTPVRAIVSAGRGMPALTFIAATTGVMQFLDERVNRLPAPFELEWRHVSGKPWDWKLVRISNPAFQIPADAY